MTSRTPAEIQKHTYVQHRESMGGILYNAIMLQWNLSAVGYSVIDHYRQVAALSKSFLHRISTTGTSSSDDNRDGYLKQ